ncbi:MAG: Dyp-type peroxidase [Myxococcaceae bacterium]|nr:Dyp-type peroxidase [Myxococcaceae bacterium]
MNSAGFLFLKIQDARRCGQWLRELLPALTTAATRPREEVHQQESCLNLALTWEGLKALGLERAALETFPFEFRKGMSERARVLGDTGSSAPEHWEFGGTQRDGRSQRELHLLLVIYGRDEETLNALLAQHRARFAAAGLEEIYCQRTRHLKEQTELAGRPYTFLREHFGFRDSLSQPSIEGFRDAAGAPPSYDPAPLKAGEFILGYENEYGERPPSPSVSASQDPAGWLGESWEEEGRKDLGRHGTYLVLRKLQQDVSAFNDFVEQHRALAARHTPDPEKQAEWLKSRMIGRWPDGAPLKPGEAEQPAQPPVTEHGISNAFDFRADPHGFGCPLTSHTRRANPRDSLPPERALSLMISRRHRILRRGIPYGPRYDADREGQERGLVFVSLNANIARQFEFIQQSWMNNEKAGGLYDERDPVTSSVESGRLTLPERPLRLCLTGLQHFVTMKGGGYFFLPSVRALHFLAELAPQPPSQPA